MTNVTNTLQSPSPSPQDGDGVWRRGTHHDDKWPRGPLNTPLLGLATYNVETRAFARNTQGTFKCSL